MKHHHSSLNKRIRRVRSKIFGTATRPRLSVDRSTKHLAVQLIDDALGQTLLGLSTAKVTADTKTARATALGQQLAEAALKKGIKMATLDRGPFRYGGRIKAFTEAARQAGLKI